MTTSNWLQEDLPLSYQLSYSVDGDNTTAEPVIASTFKPGESIPVQLPGGLAAYGSTVTLRLFARNAAGAVTAAPLVRRVVVSWPALQDLSAQTAFVSAATSGASAAVAAGSPDTALALAVGTAALINSVSRGNHSRSSSTGAGAPTTTSTSTTSSTDAAGGASGPPGGGGGGSGGSASDSPEAVLARAQQREELVSVIAQAASIVRPSADSLEAVAAAISTVVSVTAEVTPAAQGRSLQVLAAVAGGGGPRGDAAVSQSASRACVQALSGIVQAALFPSSQGRNAAAAGRSLLQQDAAVSAPPVPGSSSATMSTLGAAVSVLDTLAGTLGSQLDVPGEAPAAVSAGSIALSVQLDSPAGEDSRLFRSGFSAPGAAAAFAPLPQEAAAALRNGTSPEAPAVLSQFLSLAFSPYPDDQAQAAGGAADEAASQPMARLLFTDTSGAEIPIRGLPPTSPVLFSMRPPRGGRVSAGAAASCRFWSEERQELSTEGCAAMPSPRPPLHTLSWAAPEAAAARPRDLSALWDISGPLVENCEVVFLDCSTATASARQPTPTNGSAAYNSSSNSRRALAYLDPQDPLSVPAVRCPAADVASNRTVFPSGPPAAMRVFVGHRCRMWVPDENGCWWNATSQGALSRQQLSHAPIPCRESNARSEGKCRRLNPPAPSDLQDSPGWAASMRRNCSVLAFTW